MTTTNVRAGEVPALIRRVAEEIAGIFYDDPRSERFRKTASRERDFIKRWWPKHVEQAVEALAMLLAQPGTPEAQKEQIYEAIVEYQIKRQRRLGDTPISMRTLQ